MEQKTKQFAPVDERETLYRGVILPPGDPPQIVPIPGSNNKWRLSSGAFRKRSFDSDGLSVDIASKTTPEDSLARLPRSGALACFEAKTAIDLGLLVVEAPIVDEDDIPDNLAHALIIEGGKTLSNKIVRKQLAKSCVWAIPPKGYDMAEPIMTIPDKSGLFSTVRFYNSFQ